MIRHALCVRVSLALALLLTAVSALAETKKNLPVRTPNEDVDSSTVRNRQSLAPNKDLLFNGWGVTPAGEHVACSDMALKMVVAPDKKAVVAVCAGHNEAGVNLIGLDAKRQRQFIPIKEVFNGLAFSRDGTTFYVSGGDSGVIYVFDYADGKATLKQEVKPLDGIRSKDAAKAGNQKPLLFLAGIAVNPSTGALYICNEANHEIWVLDPDSLKLEKTIGVGQHPHTCVFGADGRHLYVSNWGSRSVSVVDTKAQVRLRDVPVGIRPNDMALAPDGRLFIACAGDNTVHVIATAKLETLEAEADATRRIPERAREIISTSLYPQSPEGSTPCSVAIAYDGKTLFVVNADNNAVMVVDISGGLKEESEEREDAPSVVNGFIPTGWYPSAVAIAPDDRFLLVANGKGLASRPSSPSENPRWKLHTGIPYQNAARGFKGSISFVPKPDAEQMAAYTAQVRRNSPYHPEYFTKTPSAGAGVIPVKVGDPCPIKYVLYIIKENRTYDQILGDMKDANGKPIGNGDPSLTMYGENVTPNQHQLARDYVLLDNIYCNSDVSVDGHSWTDAAMATDFNQRSWIIHYSKRGELPGNSEMMVPANGYLWDLCRRHGLSFKNYGEGAQRVPAGNRGKWSRGGNSRDMDRVKYWIDDLHTAEKSGELPRFTIMSLGENHTRGTSPGAHTPDACVGSNDLAVGRIVEAASRSKFWKEMAIFIIEDDAQNGADHVDAHRTVGLVISPYCRRNAVDSTLYTIASMVRTMELILGLPPMTQYDAGATPMFNTFQVNPQLTAYTALMPKVDLQAKNTEKSPFAKESSRMNFLDYDLAPEDELNRILWRVAKGPNVPYPAPIHRALFTSPMNSAQ
jgi:YVTN family beta-propeller protein